MKVTESLSSFLAAEPENSLTKRVLTKFLPRTTLAATAAFALASMAVEWDLPVMQAAVPWILKATEYTNADPIDGLIVSNILYIGERVAMSIVEIMLKPLLNAQLEKGKVEGEAAAEARFQQWKERQISQGVVFADEDEEEWTENSAQ